MTEIVAKKRPFFLRIWFFIALGVAMMLSAAAIQFYGVGANNREIERATIESMRLNALIDQTWQQVQTIERKKEMLVVVASAPKTYTGFGGLMPLFLSGTAIKSDDMPKNPDERGAWLVESLEAQQQMLIDRINEVYTTQKTEEWHIFSLKQRNERMSQLALFLQMLGLLLVMLKDVARFW